MYAQLETLGRQLDAALADCDGITLTRIDSLFWLQHRDYPGLFRDLLDRGIYLPPSPVETAFLSAAHSEDDITALASALRDYCSRD